jgi:thiosulfate/3-mercaptopyruvate sulfurtransferase
MQIVDARNAKRFAGTEPEPREATRLGHIPGSRNLPFSHLVTREHTLKLPNELRAEFEAAGVDIMKPVVATCGSGVTACMVALGLAVLGHEQTAVYDGSWAEWNEVADLPVEQG